MTFLSELLRSRDNFQIQYLKPKYFHCFLEFSLCFIQTDDVSFSTSCPVRNNPLKKRPLLPPVPVKNLRGTQWLPRGEGTFDDLLHLSGGDFQRDIEKSKQRSENTQSGNFHFHYKAKLPAVSQFAWLRVLRLIASEDGGRGRVSELSTNCSGFHRADDKHFHPPPLPARCFGAKTGHNSSSRHNLQMV